MGQVLPKQVLDLFIMFSTKKQRRPLLQIHLELHWGGDPFTWKKKYEGKIPEIMLFYQSNFV